MVTSWFVLHIVLLSLAKCNLSNSGTNLSNRFHYTLATTLWRSYPLSDPETRNKLARLLRQEFGAVEIHLNKMRPAATLPKVDKTVLNLYAALKHFMDANCLVVVNNFEGIDINPTIEYPLILRQFELGIGRVEYFHPINQQIMATSGTIWIPKEAVFKLNGKFWTATPSNDYFSKGNDWARCSLLQYIYSLWPTSAISFDCLRPNSFNFILSSRPWQCEIQVDLFMSDNLLSIGKYTQIFDNLGNTGKSSVPSVRPPVHILVDRKSGVAEYDWVALAAWTSKRNDWFRDSANDNIVNHIQITGHVSCHTNSKSLHINYNCNIETFNILFPCPQCRHFLNANIVKASDLSFHSIFPFDQAQKLVAFPGEMSASSNLMFGGLIAYYANQKGDAIKFPLKSLQTDTSLQFADKLNMLSFAYASIFIDFMGNITTHKTEEFKNPDYDYFTYYLKRVGRLIDWEYPEYLNVMRVNNVFGQLHFVSCGSRGIQPFPFPQFISVFKWEVWLIVLIAIALLSFAIVKLYKGGRSSHSLPIWPLSIYKVLVEQGDPFPENFDKSKPMRYIMAGIFLAGVVISNAFKSENVYKIVLPRGQIPYHNIDELLEDNVTIYTRIQSFNQFFIKDVACDPNYRKNYSNVEILGCSNGFHLWILGYSEIFESSSDNRALRDLTKIRNNSRLHQDVVRGVWEAIDFLHDLEKVSLINGIGFNRILTGNALTHRSKKLEEKLIDSSLDQCSKTAWVLPNYLAQEKHRFLKKAGKPSDVGSNWYNTPETTFSFLHSSYVPSSILQRFSLIPTTGLLEWWPRFVNRSDLAFRSENIFPTKPNMSGNILVIFALLGGGFLLAIICLILEVCVLNWHNKQIYKRCTAQVLSISRRALLCTSVMIVCMSVSTKTKQRINRFR